MFCEVIAGSLITSRIVLSIESHPKEKTLMKPTKRLAGALALLLINAGYVLAQHGGEPETCAGCGICGGGLALMVIIPVIFFV